MRHPAISAQITFLSTPSLAQTARFYEETIGLRLALDQGTCRIYQVGRESYIGFCQRENLPTPPGSENSNQVIITLVTPDVDGWYQYLTERGVEFDQAPVANSTYNIYHCFLRDPNGYLVEIQRFLHLF
jgi:catechol 2,3-dioxygenase-like lactoylglutathione lyase family enzyme